MRVLGPLEIEGVEKAELGGLRQQSVLVLLALNHGGWISRDRIVSGVWDDPPASAVPTLQGYVSHLRSALHAATLRIESRQAEYALSGGELLLDAQRFEAASASARESLAEGSRAGTRSAMAELAGALGLWRGPALEGFRDQPFAAPEAARLDALRLSSQIDYLRAAVALGEHGLALPQLASLMVGHPFDEELRALQILALYRNGRQVDALAAYRAYRRQLSREMALEPGPLLRDLERAVLKHDTRLLGPGWVGTASVRGGGEGAVDAGPGPILGPILPAWTTSFVGRRAELQALSAALASRRMVTITGPGGSGKTRLAAAFASLSQDVRRAVFVDVGSLSDPERVVGAVAAAFRAEGPAVTADQLARALVDEPTLVILDGCEHVSSAVSALCDALIQGSPRLRLLVTSRQPLEVGGERVFELPPLGVDPDPAGIGGPSYLGDAVALFLDRAQLPRAGSEMTDGDHDLIVWLCRRLEGLPLAIELAAVSARTLALSDVLERLGSRISTLDAEVGTRAPGGQTLRGTLDWSYRLLTPDQQLLFRQLGVFRGPFDIASVEAVVVDTFASGEHVAGTLAQLVGRSLVSRRPGPTVRRYTLLDATREFALERAEEASELEFARSRHAAHFRDFGLAAMAALSGPSAPRWIAQLALAEHDLVAAADELRRTQALEDAARLELAIASYALGRYRLGQIRDRIAQLGLDSRLSPETRLEALRRQGQAEFLLDDFDAAEATFAAAQAIAETAQLHGPNIRIRVHQAEVLRARNGDADQTLALLNSLVDEAREVGQVEAEIEALRLIAAVNWDRGELALARPAAEAAHRLAQRHGQARWLADTQNALSGILRDLGELTAAEEMLDLAGAYFRAIEDPLESAYNEYSRGRIALLRGDTRQALELAEESRRNFSLISEPWGLAMAERLLGEAALAGGEISTARSWLESSLTEMEERGFASDVVAVLEGLARVALAEGDCESAAATCQDALGRLTTDGRSRYLAPVLSTLARAELALGQPSAALRTAEAALREADASGAPGAIQEARATRAAVGTATAKSNARPPKATQSNPHRYQKRRPSAR
ncbi:MAG TPA: BTAD domain-containing putative transcriptional regulator [Candidatus Dormibacteraeota bacterium]|nr:BTAD domain-containing putative transcriptional regulator [Candidatus Dormibacteraeota bacterium]